MNYSEFVLRKKLRTYVTYIRKNGTLTNHKNLTTQEVLVDSHAITHAIAERGYEEALKELQGAFTLVWYDAKDKCLRFVRNDQRPLHMIHVGHCTYLSSELGLAKWIMLRDNNVTPKYTSEEVKPGYMYEVEVDSPENITKQKVTFWTRPTIVQVPEKVVEVKKDIGTQSEISSNDFSCVPGDEIIVRVIDVVDYVSSTVNTAGCIKAERIFPDQAPVYIFVTQDELDLYRESGETLFKVKVDRLGIIDDSGKPMRIYAKKLDLYEPDFDCTGTEVFQEEWLTLRDHRCKNCGNTIYWKDIHLSRFKYKGKYKSRIVCKDCVQGKRK